MAPSMIKMLHITPGALFMVNGYDWPNVSRKQLNDMVTCPVEKETSPVDFTLIKQPHVVKN